MTEQRPQHHTPQQVTACPTSSQTRCWFHPRSHSHLLLLILMMHLQSIDGIVSPSHLGTRCQTMHLTSLFIGWCHRLVKKDRTLAALGRFDDFPPLDALPSLFLPLPLPLAARQLFRCMLRERTVGRTDPHTGHARTSSLPPTESTDAREDLM